MTMNRRAFLKTTAAIGVAALCPSLLIRPQRRRTIDLRAFCGDQKPHRDSKGNRIVYSDPFEQRDWLYATDSKACVRVEPLVTDVTIATKDLPPAADLPWWDHRGRTGFVQMPDHPTILEAEDWCLACDGRGVEDYSQTVEHEWCEGYGCQKCRNSGRMAPDGKSAAPWCKACDGNASVIRPSIVVIGERWYAIEQWERLRTLGAVEISASGTAMDRARWTVANWNDHPSRFVFSEGIGLQMPLNRETAQRRVDESNAQSAYRKLFPVEA